MNTRYTINKKKAYNIHNNSAHNAAFRMAFVPAAFVLLTLVARTQSLHITIGYMGINTYSGNDGTSNIFGYQFAAGSVSQAIEDYQAQAHLLNLTYR